MTQPPTGQTPAQAAADPYQTVHTDLITTVPKPGEPNDGSATSLTIKVPAEQTTVDLGAGTPPGIRMEDGSSRPHDSRRAGDHDLTRRHGRTAFVDRRHQHVYGWRREDRSHPHFGRAHPRSCDDDHDEGEERTIKGELTTKVNAGDASYTYAQKLDISSQDRKEPRQANLWVSQSGSGRPPRAWYRAISACS